jgi:hypothetical protein
MGRQVGISDCWDANIIIMKIYYGFYIIIKIFIKGRGLKVKRNNFPIKRVSLR